MEPSGTQENLRIKFQEETGISWLNSQGKPDVNYVAWLEARLKKQWDKINSFIDEAPKPPLSSL